MFKLEMKTENDAFAGSVADEKREIARILRETADRLEAGGFINKLRDVDGNTVGQVTYVSEQRV